jgi:hypothetical protein
MPVRLTSPGHERFSMNLNDCNALGPGGYNAPGMEGLTRQRLSVRQLGQRGGYYSAARGLGNDDMLVTSAGLWIAGDNLDGSSQCGALYGRSGICFLPYK